MRNSQYDQPHGKKYEDIRKLKEGGGSRMTLESVKVQAGDIVEVGVELLGVGEMGIYCYLWQKEGEVEGLEGGKDNDGHGHYHHVQNYNINNNCRHSAKAKALCAWSGNGKIKIHHQPPRRPQVLCMFYSPPPYS